MTMPIYNEYENDFTLETKQIIKQLGGNLFIMMTGAKDFVKDREGRSLTFKFGRGFSLPVNCCKISINSEDLYDMEFYKIRGLKTDLVKTCKGIYCDMLAEIFEQETGLRLLIK